MSPKVKINHSETSRLGVLDKKNVKQSFSYICTSIKYKHEKIVLKMFSYSTGLLYPELCHVVCNEGVQFGLGSTRPIAIITYNVAHHTCTCMPD